MHPCYTFRVFDYRPEVPKVFNIFIVLPVVSLATTFIPHSFIPSHAAPDASPPSQDNMEGPLSTADDTTPYVRETSQTRPATPDVSPANEGAMEADISSPSQAALATSYGISTGIDNIDNIELRMREASRATHTYDGSIVNSGGELCYTVR